MNFNYSFKSRSPLINGFVDPLLIETGPTGMHCLWDPPNPRSELYTHLAAEHPRQHNRVYAQTVRRPERRLDEVGYVNSVNFAQCNGMPSCWKTNSPPHSWQIVLQQRFTAVTSVYLGSFIDKVYLCLACLGYCHWYHHFLWSACNFWWDAHLVLFSPVCFL